MANQTFSAQIYALRTRVGELAARAVRGEDLITGAISDASDTLNEAVVHLRNGDIECVREAIQLATEQLDTAEQ